jgi:hypothetical protein
VLQAILGFALSVFCALALSAYLGFILGLAFRWLGPSRNPPDAPSEHPIARASTARRAARKKVASHEPAE